jgi:predicted nucleic acid-binding Zn ribbon protein
MEIDDLDKQLKLGHLLLQDRKCRVCGEIKNLVDGFYRTRKDRGPVASSYSYECKECTIKRIVVSRMTNTVFDRWEYPDW